MSFSKNIDSWYNFFYLLTEIDETPAETSMKSEKKKKNKRKLEVSQTIVDKTGVLL